MCSGPRVCKIATIYAPSRWLVRRVQMSTPRFDAYARRKTEAAVAAHLEGFATVREPEETENLTAVGNVFTRRLFDGPFYRSAVAPASGMPVVSAVFVQSLPLTIAVPQSGPITSRPRLRAASSRAPRRRARTIWCSRCGTLSS